MSKLINELNEGFGVAEYSEVMERLENGISPTNFTGGTGKTLKEDKFGRISIKDFFEGNNGSGVFNGEILTMQELEELTNDEEEESEYFGFDWTEKTSDNTYNYSGQLEREMNFTVYENNLDETLLVFYSIHIGLDVRAGYTKAVAVKYENEYDYEEDLFQYFYLGGASFSVDGKEYDLSIDGSPISEYYRVYISDENGYEYMDGYEEETVNIDMYDKEDFKNSLIEYFKENEIAFDENSIKVID